MKTLKELNEELDAFNATLNDENEDTPELLAEQERLLNAVTAAEAADLTALSAKALIAHFNKRAPGEPLAKGLSKAQLIAKIEALPPLAAPEPTPEPPAAAEPESFAVAGYALRTGSTRVSCAKSSGLRDCALRTPLSRSRKR
jgi:hypothetical protein